MYGFSGLQRFGRRKLLQMGGLSAAGSFLSSGAAIAGQLPPPSSVDIGAVKDGKVVFDPWRSQADTPSGPPPAPLPPSERVGFAVVALGRLSLEQILPAFSESRRAKLVALVSGTPEKLDVVAKQYGIKPEACYSYDRFEELKNNREVKVVYIVLPNGMHREYTERAAAIGKHVLCEKPMSVSAKDAEAMVAACKVANVKLMIAYRIQYETYNLRLAEFVRGGTFGRLVGMSAINVQTVADDGAKQWRHKKAMAGGGSLPDIGLYCLNTARFLTGEEPVDVMATQFSPAGDSRYAEVEETVSFTLRFPSNFIANCFASYGARDDKYQRLNFERAAVDMPNAYLYEGQEMTIIRRDGDDTGQNKLVLQANNQFAAEIDHIADCVREDRSPRTPGEEGVQDHVLMEAIYQSASSGSPVRLQANDRRDAFRGMPAAVTTK
jgi:predicted dehydrogenase